MILWKLIRETIQNMFLDINLNILLISCLMIFIISIFIIKIHNHKNPLISKEILLKDKHLYLIFLDQFFINKKYLNITYVFLYIILYFLIFVFLRYLAMNQIYSIPQLGNFSWNIIGILYILIFYLALILLVLLYKTFLNLLFKKEINKFLIYFSSFDILFEKFVDFICLDISDRILGTLREFFYRTSNQTYRENLFPFSNHPDLVDDEGNSPECISLDNEFEYQVRNKYLIALAYATQDYLKTHKKIKKLFKFISYILRFLHVHTYILKYYFPYFIIILSFIYDIYNKEIKITYITLFIWIIIKLQRDLALFFEFKSYYPLNHYFYKNNISYKTQREFLLKDKNITIVKKFNTEQNAEILEYNYRERLLKDIFDNNFGWKPGENNNMRFPQDPNKAKGMYRRVYIIFLFCLIYLYLYLQNCYAISSPIIFSIIIIIIFISLIFTHYKTYHVIKYDECYEHSTFKYNRNYNILFWIIVVIQIYFFWSIIFYPQLILLQSEILFNTDFLTIKKIFTQKEKILYLYQYFEYYNFLLECEKNYLRDIIKQIDFNSLIDENITLKDIQVYIKLLNDNYILNEHYEKKLQYYYMMDIYIMTYLENKLNNPLLGTYDPNSNITNLYNFLKGILIAGALTTTIGAYVYIGVLVTQIQDPYKMGLLVNNILKSYLKVVNKVSSPQMPPKFYYKNVFQGIKNFFIKLSEYFFSD